MIWNSIVRLGEHDSFEPAIDQSEPRISHGLFRPADPWDIGTDVLRTISKSMELSPSPIAVDLLNLATAVYATDLRIPRKLSADRWQRSIHLHMPVREPDLWAPLQEEINRVLSYLTGDSWDVRFRAAEPFQLPTRPKRAKVLVPTDSNVVALFSGGLDSLVGAIDLLEDGQRPVLVGHHGSGMTKTAQNHVLQRLRASYDKDLSDLLFFVQPHKQQRSGEQSMRSRSFLFLSLGVLVSTALAHQPPLVVAENGLISLNIPLTPSRMGSLSTRTTHPFFVKSFQNLLAGLGIPTIIETPYRFQTKGEMLKACKSREVLRDSLPLSMSCSHSETGRFAGSSPGVHCGYCVPCLIRRASTRAARFLDSPYRVDVLAHPPDPTSQTGSDLRAFQMAIERLKSLSQQQRRALVLSSGPLPADDILSYGDVFIRGINEVGRLLSRPKQSPKASSR
jgi:hypothetical protein